MGYREWRQRQLDRADAMTAWADKTDQRLSEEKQTRAQEQAAREEQNARDHLDAQAARLGEDHDDLVRRARAVGMDEYVPQAPGLLERSNQVAHKLRWAAPFSAILHGTNFGDGARQTPGPYEAWRDRIVVEEAAAAKLARGEELTRLDRAALKLARYSSK